MTAISALYLQGADGNWAIFGRRRDEAMAASRDFGG